MDDSAGPAAHILELCSTVARTVELRQAAVFDQLWSKGRLHVANCQEFALPHDPVISRLILKALETRRSAFVRVPSFDGYTTPLVFATAIAALAVENIEKSVGNTKVLMVGTTTDVRRYLGQTQIGSTRLDSIFRQAYLPKTYVPTGDSVEQALLNNLPRVIASFDPVDVKALIKTVSPQWIAADIRKYSLPDWLPALVDEVVRVKVPLILFYRAPFREMKDLAERCSAYSIDLPLVGECNAPKELGDSSGPRWTVDWSTRISPKIPTSETAISVDRALAQAQARLANAMRTANAGHLERSSLMMAWRAYRCLTTASCPMSLAESGANSVWGVTPWTQLEASLQSFLKTLGNSRSSIYSDLEAAFDHLQLAREHMGDTEVPIWNALLNLILESGPEKYRRLIVFHSRAKRSLFEFALLARCNISVADLDTIGIELADFAQLNTSYRTVYQEDPFAFLDDKPKVTYQEEQRFTVAGTPSWSSTVRLDPWTRGRAIDVYCYSHQVGELKRQVTWLAHSLGTSGDDLVNVLESMGARWHVALPTIPPQIQCVAAGTVDGSNANQLTSKDHFVRDNLSLAPQLDSVEEVRALLQVDDDDGGESEVSEILDEGSEESGAPRLLVHEAVEIQFAEEVVGLFAANDYVNVVITKDGNVIAEPRYVRSVRKGDVLFFIHGSRRQSLYDVLINRLHKDPALEVPLELIRRWQEQVAKAFRSKHLATGYGTEDLLKDLQLKGSSVSVPLTVYFWVTGHTLGPIDREDLARLGSVLDIPLLRDHHAKVAAAVTRIRGLHRSLANRLNRWIEAQLGGSAWDSDEEPLDQELGLYLRDFRDSVQLLHVTETQTRTGTYLWRSLGQLTRKG